MSHGMCPNARRDAEAGDFVPRMPPLFINSNLFSFPNHTWFETFQNEPCAANQIIMDPYVVVSFMSLGPGAHGDLPSRSFTGDCSRLDMKIDTWNLPIETANPVSCFLSSFPQDNYSVATVWL